MSESHSDMGSPSRVDDKLADAVEEITKQLAEGKQLRLGDLRHRYQDIADELQDLIPIMAAVAEHATSNPNLSRSIVSTISGDLELGMLGDFRILNEVGRGGMGIVYEAEQVSLGRRVAVKILPFASLLDQRQLERFRNEARAAAMLKHTNIVSVYQVSCERGVHYYAMELIAGQSLADVTQLLDEDPENQTVNDDDPTRETVTAAALSTQRSLGRKSFYRNVARLGIQAAEALHYAHQEGVVHRDIKPSNLLLDEQGKLWVTDFGLAQIQGNNDLTMTGDLVGTLRYMSPEQAAGKLLDGRTDIYSLGLVLYELLTLKPAFTSNGRHELLQQIHEKEPCSPGRVNPSIPKDLETIVLKAIAKQPESRYQTCQELAADLNRFVQHKPVRARRSSTWERSVRWARRNPLIASLTIALAALLTVFAVGASVTALRQASLVKKTQVLLDDVTVRNYALSVAAAYDAFEHGDIARAEQLLAPLVFESAFESTPPFELGYLWNQCQNVIETPTSRSLSTQGPMALTSGGRRLVTTHADGVIRIWDADSLNLERTYTVSLEGQISALAVSRSGQIAIGTNSGAIHLIRGDSLDEQAILQLHNHGISELEFSPDESKLAYADDASVVRLCSLGSVVADSTPRVIDDFRGNTRASIAFSPDGRVLVTAGGWATAIARVWSVSDQRLIKQLHVSPEIHGVVASSFSPDGAFLVTAGKQITLWSTSEWSVIERFDVDNHSMRSVCVSPDGRIIAASDREQIRLFDVTRRRELDAIQAHRRPVTDIGFSASHGSLISSGQDGLVKIWPEAEWTSRIPNDAAPTCNVGVCFTGPTWKSPICVSFGQGFFAVEEMGQLSLLDPDQEKWTLCDEFRFPTLAMASCPTAPHIVAVARKLVDETWGITIWDTIGQKALTTLPGHRGAIYCLAFSPNGEQLASAGCRTARVQNEPPEPADLRLIVWDVETRSIRHEVHSPNIVGLSFSPDGRRLATTGGGQQHNNKVRFLDVVTGKWEAVELLCDDKLLPVQFSPGGDLIACGDYSGRLYVWDVTRERRLFTARVSDVLSCLAFSPDGRTIATGSSDATVQLWHVATGSRLATLRPQRTPATVVFSDDGNALVAGCADASVALWHIDGRKSINAIPIRRANSNPLDESTSTRAAHFEHDQPQD